MFLTAESIKDGVEYGHISISDFDPSRMGPNSYDVTLNSSLLVYTDLELDMRKENPTKELIIPEEGLLLEPGQLYIGSTNETATSHRYIPMFEGRSSIGRLGISTHITAGFGDVGWGYEIFRKREDGLEWCLENGFTPVDLQRYYRVTARRIEEYFYVVLNPTWTLEISVVRPVKVYPNVRLGQVYFVAPSGIITHYSGKYSRQKSAQASLSHKDFSK